MDKVILVTRDGKKRAMKQKLAAHLQKAGKGFIEGQQYLTRDMEARCLPGLGVSKNAVWKATEAAEKLAAENDIDLSKVQGTGKDGVITVDDVKKA